MTIGSRLPKRDALEPAIRQRPVELASPEAKRAVDSALAQIRTQSSAGQQPPQLAPMTVETDDLGMTHIRFERMYGGLKVHGEHAIAHLDRTGTLTGLTGSTPPISPTLDTAASKLSAEAARGKALQLFGVKTDRAPSVEKVVVRGDDGAYRVAYHVECFSLSDRDGPKRQHYLIDAGDGALLSEWNAIRMVGEPPANDAGGVSGRKVVEHGEASNVPIPELVGLSYAIDVQDDFRAGKANLNLEIDHASRGDLKITLTSPSGQTAWVWDRDPGYVKKDFNFDLHNYFDRDPVKGEWKLRVIDESPGDEGTLKSWKLTLEEGEARPIARAPGAADDTTVLTGSVDLSSTRRADGQYELLDRSRGQGIETRDALGEGNRYGAEPILDSNDVWGEATDDERNKFAVDAHYAAQMTYDYYKEVLGRDSIDNKGQKLVNNLHNNKRPNNAYWDGYQMNYGDSATGGSMATLDIAGHEITHGLVQHTAGFEHEGEPGALDESFADIVGGAGVEWYALQKRPDLAGKLDPYVMLEQLGDPLRQMADPSADGKSIDHYSKLTPKMDPHRASGIGNNAFYLLTHGGTNKTSHSEVKDPIPMERGLKIFARALTNYLTPTATFAQARKATVQAAADLYGPESAEVSRVKDAWTAVGVSDP